MRLLPTDLRFKQAFSGLLLCAALFTPSPAKAEPIYLGVVGKTKNDSFYVQAFEGCQLFARTHPDVRCLYEGPADYQDIRGQVAAVKAVLAEGIDGLLISITDSQFLAENILRQLHQQHIPVITFDSDLLKDEQRYRLAYVGTNNFDFGVAMGNVAKRFKRAELTSICLQSGHESTPNLNERIRGVRFALSGNTLNQRLNGEHGWNEPARCPFYTLGKRSTALFQLQYVLDKSPETLFLAVAGFAQFSPHYVERISPYRELIKSGTAVIISADTEPVQLNALGQNLSTANIGQQPFEMGRLGAELLYKQIKNQQPPDKEHYYLDFHYCTPENATNCTQAQGVSPPSH